MRDPLDAPAALALVAQRLADSHRARGTEGLWWPAQPLGDRVLAIVDKTEGVSFEPGVAAAVGRTTARKMAPTAKKIAAITACVAAALSGALLLCRRPVGRQ